MTKPIFDRITQITFSVSTIPVVLFFICFMAFGLLAGQLGFYGDEWNMVFEYATRGARGLAEYLYYDGHPTATWSYIASFQLLGINPAAWHLYNLIWRWLAVVGFWLMLKELWPQRRLETLMAAVFFALYPQFYYDSFHAVSYFEVWMGYFLLWMSFWFNIKAIRQPEKRGLFLIISILFKIGHIFTSEYTWGTELIRPLILWAALAETGTFALPEKLKKIVVLYWPHLLLSFASFGWRIFLYESPVSHRAQPKLLDGFSQAPWQTLQNMVSALFQDVVLMLFSAWQKIVQPALFDLSIRSNVFELLLVMVSAFAFWWYLKHLDMGSLPKHNWAFPALAIGIAALLFGLIPFYVAGYTVNSGDEFSNGRFVLGSLPGIALLAALALSFFVDSTGKRLFLFALMLGLMVGWQFNGANESRKLWDTQEQFYRQLLWRAPVIAPDTALISNEVLNSPYMHRSVNYGLNTLYPSQQDAAQLDYWFLEFADTTLFGWKLKIPGDQRFRPFVAGTELKDEKYGRTFSGNSRQSIYLSYRPDQGRCLWLMTVDQANAVSDRTPFHPLAKINAFERISPGSGQAPAALAQIFGPDSAADQNWCYFFEKADLARQLADWQTVRRLWSAAESASVQPGSGFEYFPFIEAYARAGDWDVALKLVQAAQRLTPSLKPDLCPFWSRFKKDTSVLAQNMTNQKRITAAFACQP